MGEHKSRGARKALALAEHPITSSTVQVGITSIGVLTGVFGGEAIGLAIASWFGGLFPGLLEYARTGRYRHRRHPDHRRLGIFGELVPKRLALTNPGHRQQGRDTPDLLAFQAKPVVVPRSARPLRECGLRLLGIQRDDARNAITEEVIQDVGQRWPRAGV